jgi:hypothetical protein
MAPVGQGHFQFRPVGEGGGVSIGSSRKSWNVARRGLCGFRGLGVGGALLVSQAGPSLIWTSSAMPLASLTWPSRNSGPT